MVIVLPELIHFKEIRKDNQQERKNVKEPNKTFIINPKQNCYVKITRQVTLLLLAGALSFPAYSYATQATEVLVPEVTQEKVTGTVEDALGPVIGASVMVKGTTNGVITDLEGKFSLNDVKKEILL